MSFSVHPSHRYGQNRRGIGKGAPRPNNCRYSRPSVEELEARVVLSTATMGSPPPAPLGQVASTFAHSDEYYDNFITGAFQRYLGRAPDGAGLAYWLNRMKNGLSDEGLEAGFIGSDEYILNHGGAGAGWVTGMYQDLLGRMPAQSEVDGWVNALHNGETTTQVAFGFAASAERESERITADYQKYLGRDPEPGVIESYWLNQFQHGASNESIIAGFVGSSEYFFTHNDNSASWLESAYQDVLGRVPDSAGFQSWLQLLEGQSTALTVNNVVLTAAQVDNLKQQLRQANPNGVAIVPAGGNFWYDTVSGAAGYLGQGTGAFLPAGLNIGGPVPADASNGTSGVFVNGREITNAELQFLQRLVQQSIPAGTYYVHANGDAGQEINGTDGPVLVNLIQAAKQQNVSPSYHSPFSVYDLTGISVLSDGNFIGVLES